MTRFNELFETAGCQKRVHYGVLEVIDDDAQLPDIDRSPYAIFPLHYDAMHDNPRLISAYYHVDEDIDYGLLHEMAHQLGLIDIYRLTVPADRNLVSGLAYTGPDGLMQSASPFLSEFSALAMDQWLHEAHGYYGQFMYNLPETMQLRIFDRYDQPLEGATVTAYQYCERPGQGKLITDQIKFQGTTGADGFLTLPNVDIDESLVPPVGTGDELHDNPFGYLATVGTNGVLHFRVEYDGETDYAWLDVTEANVAYWQGQTETAVFERQLALGRELTVRGTSADDVIVLGVDGDTLLVTVNGETTGYDLAAISQIAVMAYDGDDSVSVEAGVPDTDVDGGEGYDGVILRGSSDNETLSVHPTWATFQSNGQEIDISQTEHCVAISGGGRDVGYFYGSAGADTYTGNPSLGRLLGDGFFQKASGYAELYVHLEEGDDVARLYGSTEDDLCTANPYEGTLSCPSIDVLHHVEDFRQLHVFSEGGNDTGQLADDPAEDSYVVTFHALAGTEAKLFDGGRHDSPSEVNQIFLIRTRGFGSVTATAGAGDTALLYGTNGDEQYAGMVTQGSLSVPSGAVFRAVSFEQIHSVAKGGKNNTAELVGSPEKERFWGTRVYGRLSGSGWRQRLVRYNQVTAYGSGGPDVAEMFDTRYTDTFSGWPDECAYQAGRWEYRVEDFPVVRVKQEEAGSDMAHLYPAAGDTVRERTDDWLMSGDGYSITVEKSFGAVEVHDGSGSGSQRALVGSDEFPRQTLSDRDLTILAQGGARQPSQSDEEESTVDWVLRTEFWWMP
jgi:hypothetical protein